MPSLTGRSTSSAYPELLKIDNTQAGLDGNLRSIEDGLGNPTGIQIGTNMVAIFGYQFPASGLQSGQVLRVNSNNNGFEGHLLTSNDVSGLSLIATSGSYNDLLNKPTLVTKTSQLINDLGFITATTAPITSVVGRTGAITLAVSDVSGAAPLTNPSFTGVPTTPTAALGTNTTQIASTAFVQSALPTKVSQLTNDSGFLTSAPVTSVAGKTGAIILSTTDISGINAYAPLNSPAFTGTPTAPTPASGDNDTAIATTAFVNSVPYRKNRIINGRFQIWQRGTSWITPPSGTYTADRWRVDYTGTSAGTFTIGQALSRTHPAGLIESIGPSGVFSWNQTTTPNLTSLMLSTRIEGAQTLSGNTCTLSFNIALGAGSQNPFTIGVNLAQCYGTGGSPSPTVTQTTHSFTVNSSTFTRFSATFTLPETTGTYGTNNNDYLAVQFILPTNQLFSFYLTEVQLEYGPVTTPYMIMPDEAEIYYCQRYFQKTFPTNITPAFNTNIFVSPLTITDTNGGGNIEWMNWDFKIPMRSAPTITLYCVGNSSTPYWSTMTGTILAKPLQTPLATNTGMSIATANGSASNTTYVIHATCDADL
jgi:hypothetical protein